MDLASRDTFVDPLEFDVDKESVLKFNSLFERAALVLALLLDGLAKLL